MSWLFTRLDQEEAAERQRLAKLQAQLEAVQAELTGCEDRLARLAITRETVLALQQHTADAPPPDGLTAPLNGVAGQVGEAAAQAAVQAGADIGSDIEPRPLDRARLTGVNEQVVVMLAGRGQAMRAREVAVALGESDQRGRVEVMRTRLKRLVTAGWLAEQERGLFTVAAGVTGVNGLAREGAAVTDH